MKPLTTQRTANEFNNVSIADSLYLLCKSMTFPLLMSFDQLISLPLDELIDILEVFHFENERDKKEGKIIYENGEKIIEYEGLRRYTP